MTEIDHIRKCSQYFNILLCNNPEFEEFLVTNGNLRRKYPLTGLYSALGSEAEKARSFNDLLRIFRRFKQRHFLRIGARDLCRYADLSETTGQLSDLASVALQVGLDILSAHPEWWNQEQGVWRRLGGRTPLVVLGVGKLGGRELNYVSDIDLIFLHSDAEEDEGARSPCPAAIVRAGKSDTAVCRMLLSRLVHRLSRLLSDQFEGDRVFHVDFRLRPQGKDGVLVPSVSGALEHYLLQGRAWERQMLLKCRPVAGERSEGSAFVRELRPFVFRRFLDFQALGELKEMRSRILSESARFRPGTRSFDVKLGIGGIREIEFLVQSLQLVYGGRHPELDEPNTLKCLEKLSGLGLLPKGTADELKSSYTFLRNVEHYIQLDQNRQTQKLPRSREEKMRLVFAMGFEENEPAFLKALETHCSIVQSRFQELFKHEEENYQGGGEPRHDRAEEWSGSPFFARGDSERGQTGYGSRPMRGDPGPKFEAGPAGGQLGPDGPKVFEKLQETLKAYPASVKSEVISGVFGKFSHLSDPELLEKVLLRLDTYFGSVARRTGLRRLFGTVEPWLAAFCQAIASSELVAVLLSHNPSLVEGHALMTGVFVPAHEWLRAGIGLLESTEEYGEKLERIRRLKNERIIQLALADLGGMIDFAALEHEQTSLADFIIRRTLEAVRQELGLPVDLPLSVLGMGKLGSREMSYLSDLDLVFVYSPAEREPDNRIPGEVTRLIQRFMNMLSTPLQEGPGYPMDARLRPTGTHGPLVVTRKSWLEYYEMRADIWEIQALLRIRHVAGDPELGKWIEDRATEICFRQRASELVWPRICHLRSRMEKERAAETENEIDLKLGMGGLADVEFMVQGQLLVGDKHDADRQGHGAPDNSFGEFCAASSGLRVPVSVFSCVRKPAKGTSKDLLLRGGPTTGAAFTSLRALDHRVRLHTNSAAAKLDERRFEAMISLGLWPPHLEGNFIETWQDVLRLRREIREAFKRYCP